jgi:pyruvate dehydrogenase E1 component beta subunit
MTVAATTTYREAVKEGIREALASDPRTFLMGEDVGLYGGCSLALELRWRVSGLSSKS